MFNKNFIKKEEANLLIDLAKNATIDEWSNYNHIEKSAGKK